MFTYGVKLNGFSDKIWIREISNSLYRDLVKTVYNNDNIAYLKHINLVIEHVYPGILQRRINVIDKLLLLLHVRAICISPDINLKGTCPSTKKTFESSLKIENLFNVLENVKYKETVRNDSIIVDFSVIKAIDEVYFLDVTPSQKFINLLSSCIDVITYKSHKIDFSQFEFRARQAAIESLPLDITKLVYQKILDTETNLSKNKLFVVKSPFDPLTTIVDLPVSFEPAVILDFCKFVFNDDLRNLYQLMFNLVNKAQFSAEYVDQITPAEAQLYWSMFVEQAQKEKQEIENQNKSSKNPTFGGLKLPNGAESPSEFSG